MARELVRKDLPALILAVLADGPAHGYAIARDVERRSGELFRLREGSLYPALRVLEQDGLIEGQWKVQDGAPGRKEYAITAKGHSQLQQLARDWATYSEAMDVFLGRKLNEQPA